MKCIQIALLCVQESMEGRPTMSEVVLMLQSDHIALPRPARPPNFMNRRQFESELPYSSTMNSATLMSINEVTDLDTVPR